MATRTKKDPVAHLTISEIKAALKEKNLSMAGSVDVLRARLRRRYELEEIMTASESEELESEHSDEPEEEVEEEVDQEEEVEEEVDQEEEVEEIEEEVEEIDQEEEVESEHSDEPEEEAEDEPEEESIASDMDQDQSEDEEGKDADAFDYMETRLDDLEEKIQKYDLEEMKDKLKEFVKTEFERLFAEFSKKDAEVKEIVKVSKPGDRNGRFYECALDEFIAEEEEEEEEKLSDSKSYPIVTLVELDRELKKYMSGRTNVDLPYFEEGGMSLFEFLDRRGEDISKINYDTKVHLFNLGDEIINLDADVFSKHETYVNGRTVTFRYCRIQPLGSAWIVFLD